MFRQRTRLEHSAAHPRLHRNMPPKIHRVWGASTSRFLAQPGVILIPFDSARVYNILAGPGGAKYLQQFCEFLDVSQYVGDNIIDLFFHYVSSQLSIELYNENVRAHVRDDVGNNDVSDGQAVGPIANNEVPRLESLIFPLPS
jgi:hypothetical protein